MIYYYDFVAILGTIFYNVFDRLGNRVSTVADGINESISTNAMCVEAYNQMINVKNIDAKCAYRAILILATLFEKDLKAKIKIACVKEFSTRITSKN